MTALRLKGPFLALIDLAIYSEPLGSFYTPANSMATICPYHYPHHGPHLWVWLKDKGGREGKRGMVVWMMFMIPTLAALSFFTAIILRIPCLTDNGTKLLSTHLCVSHVPLEAPPQLWWIICDRATGAHGHCAPWLCLASASAESMACPGRAKRRQARLCWDLPSLFPEAHRDQACMGGLVCGCLLLIELLTQPLALGDTSMSLPMINLNFNHRPGLLPDLVRPWSMRWDINNKWARRGKEMGWVEG